MNYLNLNNISFASGVKFLGKNAHRDDECRTKSGAANDTDKFSKTPIDANFEEVHLNPAQQSRVKRALSSTVENLKRLTYHLELKLKGIPDCSGGFEITDTDDDCDPDDTLTREEISRKLQDEYAREHGLIIADCDGDCDQEDVLPGECLSAHSVTKPDYARDCD